MTFEKQFNACKVDGLKDATLQLESLALIKDHNLKLVIIGDVQKDLNIKNA